jgi:hypothetical protein
VFIDRGLAGFLGGKRRDLFSIFESEFQVDDFQISDGINVSFHVRNVIVVEGANEMEDAWFLFFIQTTAVQMQAKVTLLRIKSHPHSKLRTIRCLDIRQKVITESLT